MHADVCQIYTDVDGVYTADPRKVPKAKKLDEITYSEMLELASLGAQVLNNRSVEMAKKYGVQLEVLSSLESKPGTIVKEKVNMEKMLISGVAKDNNVSRIAIVGLNDTPGVAFKVFNKLAQAKVNIDIILQSVGRDGTKDITFTVTEDQSKEAVEAIESMRDVLTFKSVLKSTTVFQKFPLLVRVWKLIPVLHPRCLKHSQMQISIFRTSPPARSRYLFLSTKRTQTEQLSQFTISLSTNIFKSKTIRFRLVFCIVLGS